MVPVAKANRFFGLAVAGETLLAASLAYVGIGRNPFWRDEVFSAFIASRSSEGMARIILKREANMSLYYFLLHLWINLGSSEARVRTLSTVFAIAVLPIAVLFARQLFDTWTAVLTGLLLALNAFYLTYAREARTYSLTMLLTTAATYLFFNAVRRRRPGMWAAYTVLAVLAVYAHPLATLVLVGHVGSLLFLDRSQAPWKSALLSWIVVAALASPLFVIIVAFQAGQTSWIEPPNPQQVAGLASGMAGNHILAAAYLGALLVALPDVRHRMLDHGRTMESWGCSLLLCWLVVPPLLLLLVSFIKPLFLPRYLTGCLPALVILVAHGLIRLNPRWVSLGATALLVVLSAANVVTEIQRGRPSEDLRAAATMVAQQGRRNDAIAYAPAHARVGFSYYLDQVEPPREQPHDIAIAEHGSADEVGDEFPEEIPEETLASRVDHSERLWLVGYPSNGHRSWHPTPEPMLAVQRTALQEKFSLVQREQFGEVTVSLYVRRP